MSRLRCIDPPARGRGHGSVDVVVEGVAVHDIDQLMFISLPGDQVGSGNILAILPSSLVSGCQSPYISRQEHNLNIRQLSFGYMGVPVMAAAVVVAHSVNWSQ